MGMRSVYNGFVGRAISLQPAAACFQQASSSINKSRLEMRLQAE
jgi:hypothetical protein